MRSRLSLRLQSFSYVGKYLYFVTLCTYERQPLFATKKRIDAVRSQMLHTCQEKGFAIPAGVFMRDHVHLILEGLEKTSDFKRYMKRMRQMTARDFRRDFNERLWQRGYHDRVLRNRDEMPAVIAYLCANPVKEGLASCAEDYPYLWTPTKSYGATTLAPDCSATYVASDEVGHLPSTTGTRR
jgi:putative transposase